uniref:SKA complex subunit 1 n=1 Tax=Plectus sambesii TaxID=2011161 RepID=A0A914UK01_9BILA
MEVESILQQTLEDSKDTLRLLNLTTRYYEGDTTAKDTLSGAIEEFSSTLTALNDATKSYAIVDACSRLRAFLKSRGVGLPDDVQLQKTAPKAADEKPSTTRDCLDIDAAKENTRSATVNNYDDDGNAVVGNSDSERAIEPLSAEEFEAVPKYMRGRMMAGEVNAVVEKMDHLLREKRNLMQANFRRLSKTDKDRVIAWREQDTSDSAGQLFCVEKELKMTLAPKEASQLRAVIPILRHCRRIVELRGKGLIRFAVVR